MHLRKPVRSMAECKPEEWSKHLDDLKALSVLAHQAIEYSSSKSKSESKDKTSSVIKPDLIPQEKRSEINQTKKDKESPKKPQLLNEAKKLENVVGQKEKEVNVGKVPVEKIQTASKDTEKFIKAEQSASEVKQTEQVKKINQNEPTLSNSSEKLASPSKIRAKPTEIKKPGMPETGRFKTSKVSSINSNINKINVHSLYYFFSWSLNL